MGLNANIVSLLINILRILHFSGLCNTATDTHIAIHSGHYIGQSPRRLCGSRSIYRVLIREQFAYITFHTNWDTNTRRRTGFTRAEFTAQGLFIITMSTEIMN